MLRRVAVLAALLALLPSAGRGQDFHRFGVMCRSFADLMKLLDAVEEDNVAARQRVWNGMKAAGKCFTQKDVGGPFFIDQELANWRRERAGKKYLIVVVRGSFLRSKDPVYSFKRVDLR